MSVFMTSYLYLPLNWKSPNLACEVKGKHDYGSIKIQQLAASSGWMVLGHGENLPKAKIFDPAWIFCADVLRPLSKRTIFMSPHR